MQRFGLGILFILGWVWTYGQSSVEGNDSINNNIMWSLGTNMLYDAGSIPNINAEIYLGKNYSINGNWMYSWWDCSRLHKFWRIYGGSLSGRYWFGKMARLKPLTGHHIGIYGAVFTYDVEWGGTGYMAGKPGGSIFEQASYSLGIEYGYSFPVKRRLNIDFSLVLGYSGGKYYVYKPNGKCYAWQHTCQRHWWGPINVSISLVWLLGHNNINKL